MDFYQHLNFSLGNEDWPVEEQALKVASGDRVLCITASGDRALHLLMTDCADIQSIDMSPSQNFLLDLKLKAICHLDYETYYAFIGCKKTPHRKSIFKQIKPYLTPQSAAFWEKNTKLIQRGLIYQGRLERLTYYIGIFFHLFYAKKIKTLLAFDDLEKQKVYVKNHWDTKLLRKIFETLINPKFTKLLINDPGFTTFIEQPEKPGKYFYDKKIQFLNNHLATKSVLFQLLFTGKVVSEAFFPYLTLDGYNKIRQNPNRLHYQTANIVEFLHQPNPPKFDCFSMSDIASYMPQEAFIKLLEGIKQTANPGARFCLREFLSTRHIPAELKPHFKRDTALEQKLEIEESNFVYRFMVGVID